MELKYKCKECDFETNNLGIYRNHVRWKHKSSKNTENYKNFINKLNDTRSKKYRTEEVISICPECNKEFKNIKHINPDLNTEYLQYTYCSKSCANKQGSKHVDYSKVSKWAKENPRGFTTPEIRDRIIKTKSKIWSSKREREIIQHFKENFNNDGWTHGRIYKNLYPDLWSRKLKIIIEYDGIWHFKDIHKQLERKQQIDRELLKYCKENGYRLIRIDEDLKISIEEIENAVYNSNKELELFGSKRYDYLFSHIDET